MKEPVQNQSSGSFYGNLARGLGKVKDDHHTRIVAAYTTFAFLIVFIVLASIAPQIGRNLGLISLKKEGQKSFAEGTQTSSLQAESGSLSGSVSTGSDSNASGGSFIQFGTKKISGTAYYVDCNATDDLKDGKSEANAWKTLLRANNASLAPGDGLLFKRGCTWNGTLSLVRSGNATNNVIVSAYGSGNLPNIESASSIVVDIVGSHITIENIYAEALVSTASTCGGVLVPTGGTVGFQISGDFNTLQNSEATGAWAGIEIELSAQNTKVLNNNVHNNIMMKFDGGDSGAFGILIHGTDNEIAYNTIGNHDACSIDYVRDGADIEIFQGKRNSIHHNKGSNSDAFTELGGDSIKAEDNSFSYNKFTSNLARSIFLVTRGPGISYGPVYRTKVFNNSVYLTGVSSQGFVCHAGCSLDILTLKNNIFKAALKDGYSDAAFEENYNLYGGSTQQFVLGPNSKKGDPKFISTTDLHLQSTSSAINAGTTGSGFNRDLDDFQVPAPATAVDMGAYEFGSVLGISTGGSVLQATSTVNIAAVGDMNPIGNTSATSASGKNATAIAAGLANGTLDAFLGLGDFQYDVPYCTNYVNQWKTLWSGTKSKLYWISGPNHDVEPGRNEDLDNFMDGQCSGDTTKSAINNQRGFIENMTPYSFDLGNWHFAMLSSALWRYDTTRANQTTGWLDNDLTAAKAAGKHLAVSYHDPYFTSSTSSHSRETTVKPWIDIMDKHDVRLTLSGSQHNYERSCPVTKDDVCVSETDPNGMTAFQVSTGGISLRSFTSSPNYIVKRFSDTHGFLKLSLNADGSFSWTFNSVSGLGTDSGSRLAAGNPASSPTPLTPTPTTLTTASTPTPMPCTTLPQDKGVATLPVNVTQAGSYKMWTRLSAPDVSNNSIYFQVDNQCPILIGNGSIPVNSWTWVDYKDANASNKIILNLGAGSHVLKLAGNEAGVKVDRLILTTDINCIPSGLGDNCVPTSSPPSSPTITPSPIPQVDSDGDGFWDSVEQYLGTNPNKKCSDTVASNDEPVDAWPPDLNDDKKVGLQDAILFNRYFNTSADTPQKKRFDLNIDGFIGLSDVNTLNQYFNNSCAEPTATPLPTGGPTSTPTPTPSPSPATIPSPTP